MPARGRRMSRREPRDSRAMHESRQAAQRRPDRDASAHAVTGPTHNPSTSTRIRARRRTAAALTKCDTQSVVARPTHHAAVPHPSDPSPAGLGSAAADSRTGGIRIDFTHALTAATTVAALPTGAILKVLAHQALVLSIEEPCEGAARWVVRQYSARPRRPVDLATLRLGPQCVVHRLALSDGVALSR